MGSVHHRRFLFPGQSKKSNSQNTTKLKFVEPLEGRVLLTSVVVNTPIDALYAKSTGLTSLRSAILIANTSTTATTISFDKTAFATPKTIVLNGTELGLTNTAHATTITGPSVGVTVSGNSLSTVFHTKANVALTLLGLIISKGNSNGDIQTDDSSSLTLTNDTVTTSTGIGLNLNGPCTMSKVSITNNGGDGLDSNFGGTFTNVTITGNSSTGMYANGTTILSDMVISNNNKGSISNYGAGFNNHGNATLNNVTISGNSGSEGGGGIYNNGKLTLTDVSITGNVASNGGGGVLNDSSGVMTLVNVTIAGNSVSQLEGGGIDNYGNATLENVTIWGNTDQFDFGGGMFNHEAAANFTISNCIVAGDNTSTSTKGPDVYGAFNSLGYNVVGKSDGGTGFNAADQVGTAAKPLSAKLASLANNGGFTQTLLPLAGSPAIDKGLNILVPKGITTDQRGLARIVNGTVDIGAVEVQSQALIKLTAPANQSASTGKTASVKLGSFTESNATGPYKDTVKWGDGTANAVLTLSAAGTIPATAHTFAKTGTFTVSETITDSKSHTSNTVTLKETVTTPPTASISGRVFDDANGNGKRDVGEDGLGLWTVYLDLNNDGKHDTGDVSVTTDILGDWSFKNLAAGTYVVRIVPVTGLKTTTPTGGKFTIKLTAAQVSTGSLFGEESLT